MGFSNIGLTEPTPGDPAVRGIWGTILNTNDVIIDMATNGITTLSVAGASNTVLTSTPGNTAQDPAGHFNFTGTLTGSIYVLWPSGVTRKFSVANNTTGAFALAMGVNNGASLPAGTTVTVAQGATAECVSDGTNVTQIGESSNGTIPSGTVIGAFIQAAAPVGWTQVNTWNDAVLRFVDNTGTGAATGGSWSISGVTIGNVAITQAQLPACNFVVGDPTHVHPVNDPTHVHAFTAYQSGTGFGFVGGTQVQPGGNTSPAATGITIGAASTGITVASGGSNAGHNHPFSNDAAWRPSFVNSLVASKN